MTERKRIRAEVVELPEVVFGKKSMESVFAYGNRHEDAIRLIARMGQGDNERFLRSDEFDDFFGG